LRASDGSPPAGSLSGSAAGFVLAGGQSSRMGTDKALAVFDGLPLIEIALRTVSTAGVSARVAGASSSLAAYGQVVPDTMPRMGPLGGIRPALAASNAEWNIFLPVDMPLMPSSLLRWMLHHAILTESAVTTVRLNGRAEPLPVVLHVSVLATIQEQLESGQRACHVAWQAARQAVAAVRVRIPECVAVENLLQAGQCRHPSGLPPFLWFQSANTPDDLARLNRFSAPVRTPILK
jgi:molybdenum cofactor guanylyltransferase